MYEYPLRYDVPATTKLEAIFAASAKLRTGVVVMELRRCEPSAVPGYWTVVMDVREGEPPEPEWLHEQADPITAAKAEAERDAERSADMWDRMTRPY